MARIQFTIRPDGEVEIDVSCASGASCEDITKAFEEGLGGEVTERDRKPEYWHEVELVEAHES